MKRLTAIAVLVVGLVSLTAASSFSDERTEQISGFFDSSFAKEDSQNYDGALSDVLAILKLDPSNYIANYRAGWLCYLKGSHGDSMKYFTKAMTLAPGAIEPQLGLLLPLMAANKWTEAEALAAKLVSRAPDNYLAGSRLAYIYYMQGKYKQAEDQYKAVLKDYPSEIEMTLGLGWTYYKEGRMSEAKEMFQKVLTVRKNNSGAQAGLKAQ